MKLSKRGEYALRALIDLGVAAELGRPLLSLSELARREKLPAKFLEQILGQLRGAGLVTGTRGQRGGYTLGRPAREIFFGEVVRLIDGPLAPIGCVSQMAYAPCTCPDETHCGLRMLMLDVRNAIAAILDRHTLADVVSITLRKLRRDKVTSAFAGLPELSALLPGVLPTPEATRRAPRRSAPLLPSSPPGILEEALFYDI